jgi:fluoroacetyl-CoA thioesterase
MSSIEPGLTNATTRPVAQRHLANEWGSGLAAVLATPVLVAFCEECARLAVDPLLPAGQQTVGTWISLRHLAATPPGLQVTVKAELVEVQGRRLRFRVEAWDDLERIGEAEHERFIIDVARFEARVAEKAGHGSTRTDTDLIGTADERR